MTTTSRASGVGHRIAWITGPLTIALVTAGILNDFIGTMDSAISLIAHFAALWSAVATALLAGSRALKRTALILAPICWFLTFYAWFGYMWTGSDLAWSEHVLTPIFIVVMAMPPCWLLLAVWRPSRPGVDSFLAEAGALVLLAMVLFVLTMYISSTVDPASPVGALAALYAAAAVLVVLAAWRRAGRRVAYGFVALLFAALAAGSPWLFHSEDPDVNPPGFIGIEVFAPGAIAAGVVAVVLQVAWTAARKRSGAGRAGD
ncbi:hypothetical protein AB0B28_15990 [Glycomyces sp. NPDC046736]|uniref:hypothetical protein n=1 Tax=Glycomyces sp. NPDC046736 TaxID=3155615 RepID=UPI0033DDDDDC